MKRSSIGFIVFLVVAVGVIYGLSRLTQRIGQQESTSYPSEAVKTSLEHGHESEGGLMPAEGGNVKGSPEAKVKIVAILPPSECQAPTLRVLDEIAKAEPKRVRVEIYGMQFAQGFTTLAAIRCNLRFRFHQRQKGIHAYFGRSNSAGHLRKVAGHVLPVN